MKRHTITLLTIMLAGCGFGLHRNPTAAITAPYHDHQDDIEDFPELRDSGPVSTSLAINVGHFERYYPIPIGFRTGTVLGHRLSWGRAELLGWSEIQPPTSPEDMLQTAFRARASNVDSGDLPRLDGIISDLSWYHLDDLQGGRITSAVTVQATDGRLLFEGTRTTVGQGMHLEALVQTHVNQWSKDPALLNAIASAGAQ